MLLFKHHFHIYCSWPYRECLHLPGFFSRLFHPRGDKRSLGESAHLLSPFLWDLLL
jgi:hypothetical protein